MGMTSMLLPEWLLLLVSLAYLGLMFGVAYAGDRWPLYPDRRWLRPVVYSLALGVYCTAWTFYAAVGSAVTSGWYYLTIYTGPIVLLIFGHGLYARLLRLVQVHRITSIPDFIGSRFGKSAWLAMLVTTIMLLAMLPYMALQYKAVSFSVRALIGPPPDNQSAWLGDITLYAAALLALFAALFGTRKVDATEHHYGLMLAVALESLIKLVAFAIVAFLAWKVLPGWGQLRALSESLPFGTSQWLEPQWWLQSVLAALGFLCLPRQFQVGVVECADARDLRYGRWVMVVYVAIFAVLVLPIALAATRVAHPTDLPTDALVLWLTQVEGGRSLMLVAFVGGVAAASGMVIMVSVALATMVSNELVMPVLTRIRALRLAERDDLSRIVLWIRRATIALLALGGYVYSSSQASQVSLATLGLISMVAVVQVAPALIGGLLWRRAGALAAGMGMTAGFLIWCYCLFVPSLVSTLPAGQLWLQQGPWGVAALRPHALFGSGALDAITHGLLWSMGTNLLLFVGLSILRQPQLRERLWAEAFLRLDRTESQLLHSHKLALTVQVVDLHALLVRIIGAEAAQRAFDDYQRHKAVELTPGSVADRGLLQHVERALAGSLGAQTARLVLTSALSRTGIDIENVVALLDVTGKELRASRSLLEAMMENVSHGVSVVDSDLQLAAWNGRYQELFAYPPGMLYVGRPIADLIRYNASRGELGELSDEAIDEQVDKRVAHLREGSAYRYQRQRPNGQVLKSSGLPMPGGGFVTTFTDVTEFKHVEGELRALTNELEHRVTERTFALEQSLEAQRQAKQEAEVAIVSKNRFLAAASHDLLQPMNAARLFLSALRDHPRLAQATSDLGEIAELAERVDASLHAAEGLLDGLLGLSRLESGALQPDIRAFALDPFLEELRAQFGPLASRRALQFRVRAPRGLIVLSDRKLVQRVAQNLISNALRYTSQGGVLVAVRRRADVLQLMVYDTGPGIAPELKDKVFEEFSRIGLASPWGEKGMGLGLNICARIASLLGLQLDLRSISGRGSLFALGLPAASSSVSPPAREAGAVTQRGRLGGLRVLCLDNESEILDAMRALLSRWGVEVYLADSVSAAASILRETRIDVILADYQLDDGENSLQALDLFAQLSHAPVAIVAADPGEAVEREVERRGMALLHKPVKPAMLRAYLASHRRDA
jgi:Na+/proline symporter